MDNLIRSVIFGEGKWWWIRHILFWMFVYLDLIVANVLAPPETLSEFLFDLLSMVLDIIVVYINLYWLVPRYLFKGKFSKYVLLTICTIAFDVITILASTSVYYGDTIYPEDWISTFIATMTLFMTAIAIKIGKYYYHQLNLTRELKTSQTQLEMNSLKQQINPHFLFNVLNTIHIQSKTEPDQVSDTVLHLSDLLRYQIYEAGQAQQVQLEKEISFLKNYIDLEKLRRDNLQVTWQIDQNMPRIKVRPFLFLPLIENALKHSRKLDGSLSTITVDWDYTSDGLTLKVQNTMGDVVSEQEGGFGINNLKKRLPLMYPGRYDLSLSTKGDIYQAILQIKVDESDNNR